MSAAIRRLLAREAVARGVSVARLREARRYCARRGEGELCVLAAYASGPAGVQGRWYRGPRRVQREEARLRAAMGPRVMAPTRAGKVQA